MVCSKARVSICFQEAMSYSVLPVTGLSWPSNLNRYDMVPFEFLMKSPSRSKLETVGFPPPDFSGLSFQVPTRWSAAEALKQMARKAHEASNRYIIISPNGLLFISDSRSRCNAHS